MTWSNNNSLVACLIVLISLSSNFQAGGGGGVDLACLEITIEPNSPLAGDDVTFHVVVKNEGDADSPPFEARIYIDDGPLARARLSLAGGSSERFVNQPAWSATRGWHTVSCVVDEDDEVQDIDRSNNELSVKFCVGEVGKSICDVPRI